MGNRPHGSSWRVRECSEFTCRRVTGAGREGVDPLFALQETLHQADYNTYRSFTRCEAIYNHQFAKRAIHDRVQIRKTSQAEANLTGRLIVAANVVDVVETSNIHRAGFLRMPSGNRCMREQRDRTRRPLC